MSLDQFGWEVTARSGGKNKMILDNVGMPSEMVWIPRFNLSDVMPGKPATPHPAFIVNGQVIDGFWVGKYASVFRTTSGLTRAYSLAGLPPAVNHNLDTARTNARNKGQGWHNWTEAEASAIALWSKANGTMPTGNNNYGKDIYFPLETGRAGSGRESDGRLQAWLNGSGSDATYHDGNRCTGVADLNGNVRNWTGGYRLMNGKIQVIPNNDAALDTSTLQNSDSTAWREINAQGDYVVPGSTTETWGFDYTTASPGSATTAFKLKLGPILNVQGNDTPYGQAKFGSLTVDNNEPVPDILKALAIYPDVALANYAIPGSATGATQGRGDFYFRNNGERMAYRGGSWNDGASAGLFYCNVLNTRTNTGSSLGSRLAFVEL